MNVTVTNPSIASHATVWPSGSIPNASNLNFVAGQTKPNLVTVGVSGSGKVNFQLDAGSADLIADVVGYYGDGTGVGASGARFSPQAPYRILDSRVGTGGYASPWGAGVTRDLTLTSVPNDATAVVLNVTATNPTATAPKVIARERRAVMCTSHPVRRARARAAGEFRRPVMRPVTISIRMGSRVTLSTKAATTATAASQP